METKICTSIEQSERLVKLGLDKSTADMHYFSDGYNPTRLDIGYDKDNFKFYRGTKNKYIPAWSLSALLLIIPECITLSEDEVYYFQLFPSIDEWYTQYQNPDKMASYLKIVGFKETPVDACFEMVVWLIENGYIRTK